MRSLVIAMCIILFMSFPALAKQEPATPLHVLQAVQQRFSGVDKTNRITDVSGEFYQQAHIASLNRTRTGRGTMELLFIAAENNGVHTLFNWNYIVPSRQQVVSDGSTLWVYMPDNNQVMVSRVDDKSYYKEDPLLFLRNLGQLSRHFSVGWNTPQRDKQGNYMLQLTPRQPSIYIKMLILTIPAWVLDSDAAAAFPLLAATVVDPGGNTTALEFRKVKVNQHLRREQFIFKIPAGVSVVNPADLQPKFK